MWIDTKSDIDDRWIGTIYGGGYVDDYHIEQNFERFVYI